MLKASFPWNLFFFSLRRRRRRRQFSLYEISLYLYYFRCNILHAAPLHLVLPSLSLRDQVLPFQMWHRLIFTTHTHKHTYLPTYTHTPYLSIKIRNRNRNRNHILNPELIEIALSLLWYAWNLILSNLIDFSVRFASFFIRLLGKCTSETVIESARLSEWTRK